MDSQSLQICLVFFLQMFSVCEVCGTVLSFISLKHERGTQYEAMSQCYVH